MTLARPETRYAEADGVRIGYQVFGSGQRTVIGVPGSSQNIDVIWENAEAAAFFERLGSMCRVIHFDKRGTGVSAVSSLVAGSGIELASHGTHTLKGIAEPCEPFRVLDIAS